MERRKRKAAEAFGRFAGVQDDAVNHLCVIALPATLFRDDKAAEMIETLLVPWQGEQDNLMDRFDGRLLLDSLPAQLPASASRARLLDEEDHRLKEELEHELYCDMEEASVPEHPEVDIGAGGGAAGTPPPAGVPQPEDAAAAAAVAAASGPYAAVEFRYDSTEQVEEGAASSAAAAAEAPGSAPSPSPSPSEPAEDEPPYQPRFAVPPHLQPHLPASERLHRILVSTARFVAQHGGQVEVMVRVKQAGNPNFAFLSPGDRLFPYYRWLVEEQPEELPPLPGCGGAAPLPLDGAAAAVAAADGTSGQPQGRQGLGAARVQEAPSAGSLQSLLQMYTEEEEGDGGQQPMAAEGLEEGDEGGEAAAAGSRCRERLEATALPEPPPADIAAIAGKLVAHAQRCGTAAQAADFVCSVLSREASNPLFGFLQPGHRHHAWFAQQLLGGAGQEVAEAVLSRVAGKLELLPPAEAGAAAGEGKAAEGMPGSGSTSRGVTPQPEPAAMAAATATPPVTSLDAQDASCAPSSTQLGADMPGEANGPASASRPAAAAEQPLAVLDAAAAEKMAVRRAKARAVLAAKAAEAALEQKRQLQAAQAKAAAEAAEQQRQLQAAQAKAAAEAAEQQRQMQAAQARAAAEAAEAALEQQRQMQAARARAAAEAEERARAIAQHRRALMMGKGSDDETGL